MGESSLFYWKQTLKSLLNPNFFSLCWAVWLKTENACFCLRFLTVQFNCEEVSSVFCSGSSLHRSVCQCPMWGHYPGWGHQGDLYSSLCTELDMQGTGDAVCMPNEISPPSSALGPIDHCQWISAGCPLKWSFSLLLSVQIPSRAKNSFWLQWYLDSFLQKREIKTYYLCSKSPE